MWITRVNDGSDRKSVRPLLDASPQGKRKRADPSSLLSASAPA
jgi:hypothetical protein